MPTVPQKWNAVGAARPPVVVVRAGREDGAAGGRPPVDGLAAVEEVAAGRCPRRREAQVVVDDLAPQDDISNSSTVQKKYRVCNVLDGFRYSGVVSE